MRNAKAITPRTMIVTMWMPWVAQMRIPSSTAIQITMRRRWRWNQPRFAGAPSIARELSLTTGSTVPRRCRDPGAAEAAERTSRRVGVPAVMKEPVQRGTRARNICAEGARLANGLRERCAREVVRRQDGEIARSLHRREPVEERLAPLGEALHAVARVKGRIHVGRRGLDHVARKENDDPEVLRQVERLELAPVAGAELRAVGEEERDVGADSRGKLSQLLR